MNELCFEDFDRQLLNKNSKIIHQVWFGVIPNRKKARKDFKSLKRYRNSWIIKNPNWTYICWGLERCRDLISQYYSQHIEMYDSYPYHIQRCDVIRYFILHRYGGLYADMDYFCNKSWDFTIQHYPHDLYLVETPNKFYNDIHVSNSLMYSHSGNVFWKKLFIELEVSKSAPIYYSRHMTIMFTTGPGILNRVFNKYRIKYKLNHYPFKLFHPYGLTTDIITLRNNSDIYALHLGKGSWEKHDSHIIIFLYQEWKILILIILILIVPSMIQSKISKI